MAITWSHDDEGDVVATCTDHLVPEQCGWGAAPEASFYAQQHLELEHSHSEAEVLALLGGPVDDWRVAMAHLIAVLADGGPMTSIRRYP